jgi:hypothetical protein
MKQVNNHTPTARSAAMTMFSMKPKFDLAEFLATPAPAGAARSRNARYRNAAPRPAETPDDTAAPADDTDPPAKPSATD